jgi:hypothetical protein
MELGDAERADEMLATEMTIAAELNRPDLLWIAGVHRCTRVLMEGRYEDGAQLADEALAYGQAAHIETALQMYGVAQIDIARACGGLEALEPLVAGMIERYPLLPAWRTGLLYLYAMLDRPEDVRDQIEILAAQDFADLPSDANWGIAIAILILGCAYVGDRPRAAHLYEMLSPHAEYCVIVGMPAISDGSVELFLALEAGTTDRWDLADEHFAHAMERNARSGNRAWSVHGKFEYAALLVRRDDPADRERLCDLLRECLAGASEMGMTRVVDQTRSLAARAGVALDA